MAGVSTVPSTATCSVCRHACVRLPTPATGALTQSNRARDGGLRQRRQARLVLRKHVLFRIRIKPQPPLAQELHRPLAGGLGHVPDVEIGRRWQGVEHRWCIRRGLDEHPVGHQAVEVDIQVERAPSSLDGRDRTRAELSGYRLRP